MHNFIYLLIYDAHCGSAKVGPCSSLASSLDSATLTSFLSHVKDLQWESDHE